MLKISLPFTNKEQHVPKDTDNGSIVCKFKVKGTVVTLPGWCRTGSYEWLQPDF